MNDAYQGLFHVLPTVPHGVEQGQPICFDHLVEAFDGVCCFVCHKKSLLSLKVLCSVSRSDF